MTAENVAAMPAVMLAHDDGKVGIAAFAPEHSLVLDPTRALFALLRLLELLERPACMPPSVVSGNNARLTPKRKRGKSGQMLEAIRTRAQDR